MKVRNCCFCINLRKGAMTIGFLHLISLISSLLRFNPLNVTIKFFTVACFLMMLFKDTEIHRMLFFVAYVIELVILYAFECYMIMKAYKNDLP